MAHFCETYNRPTDAGATIGFDQSWLLSSGDFAIVTQASQPYVCNWPNQAIRVPDLDGEDMVGSIQITNLQPGPGGGNYTFIAICLRVVSFLSPTREFYSVEWHYDHGASGTVRPYIWIVRWKTNVATVIGGAFTAVPVPGDIFKARITGSLIEALVNGVLIASATDTQITGSHTIGKWVEQNCSNTFGDVALDNFFGADIAEEDNQCPPPPASENETDAIVCGTPFWSNPCPQTCPDDPPSSGIVVPLLSNTACFLSPLFLLGLVDGGLTRSLSVSTACGNAFTHNIPELQT